MTRRRAKMSNDLSRLSRNSAKRFGLGTAGTLAAIDLVYAKGADQQNYLLTPLSSCCGSAAGRHKVTKGREEIAR